MAASFRERVRHIQSNIYLPAARSVLLIGALLSLIVAIGGILAAAYFQTMSWEGRYSPNLPPPYTSKEPTLDLKIINARLSGPTNIRFVAYDRLITAPLSKNDAVGYFAADSANGLAPPPNDFSLLGGPDSKFFLAARGDTTGKGTVPRLLGDSVRNFRYGLVASEELNDLIKKSALDGKNEKRNFTVRVIAFDRLGNKSAQDVTFTLEFGPSPAVAEKPRPEEPVAKVEAPSEPAVKETPLTALAREIASIVDATHSPRYFDAFEKAVAVPKQCGASDSGPFLAGYRRAFDAAKPLLRPDNILTVFLPSICEAWRSGIATEQRAAAEANARRTNALAAYEADQVKNRLARIAAVVARNVALWVVLGAVAVLLLLSLPLALLLLENHSNALRAIAEKLDTSRSAQLN